MISAKEPELREPAADLPLPRSTVGIEEIAKKVSSLMALLSQGQPAAPLSEEEATSAFARQLHRERRERDSALGRDLFGEPGWDILLYLYGFEEQAGPLTTRVVCEASGAAPTTALRYLNAMLDKDWIVRSPSPAADEIGCIALSPATRGRMKDLLETMLAGRPGRNRVGEGPDPHAPRSG